MKQFTCSARVSLSHASEKVVGDSFGDVSNVDEDDDDDDDEVQGGGSARVARAAMPSTRPCYP